MLLIPCVIVMAITSNCFYELYNPPHPGPPDPITLTVTVTVTVMHIIISNFVLTKSARYNWHQDSPQITIHKIAIMLKRMSFSSFRTRS